jgi:thiol:disulfide interchange protein DsbD
MVRYVILDPTTATPLTGSRAYDEDVNAFLQFLNQGLSTHP